MAQQEANAFCIQMTVTSKERGQAGAPPPRYVWTEVFIRDIIQSWLLLEIYEVLITVPRGSYYLLHTKEQEIRIDQGASHGAYNSLSISEAMGW